MGSDERGARSIGIVGNTYRNADRQVGKTCRHVGAGQLSIAALCKQKIEKIPPVEPEIGTEKVPDMAGRAPQLLKKHLHGSAKRQARDGKPTGTKGPS
jgi:hypothetical protein